MTDLKYGYRHGPKVPVVVRMAAAQAVAARSSRFVFLDTSNDNFATLNINASARIFGHLQTSEDTPAEGAEVVCNISKESVYRIPINAGVYAAQGDTSNGANTSTFGDTCDITILAGIQGADLQTVGVGTLTIVGGDESGDNAFVDVVITAGLWATNVVADNS